MSYENAPATKLLATLCACCARPLVDAKSIETGMGPVCRKKHGYDQPDCEANWVAVAAVLLPDLKALAAEASAEQATGTTYMVETAARAVLADALRERYATEAQALLTLSARDVCNMFVYRIAALHSVAGSEARGESAKLVSAIRALGSTTLADVLTDRLVPVRITVTPTGYEVIAPYSDEFNAEVRQINGRRWVSYPNAKRGQIKGHNFIPLNQTVALHRALCAAFYGVAALGPKGTFVIGEPAAKVAA